VRLLDFTQNGCLEVNNEVWWFKKHGTGILFKRENENFKLRVDIENFINLPDFFDKWRLLKYFNSINYFIDKSDLKDELKKMELENYMEVNFIIL
jgi:hypothetical protein